MNLVIDIGNSLIKYAVFHKKKIAEQGTVKGMEFFGNEFFRQHETLKKIIISSVRNLPVKSTSVLKKYCTVHILNTKTKLPFRNYYKTPETLGRDRIAGLAGARALFPGKHILIIDAGTCITTDFINADGEYFGGTISPGLTMKLKAVHTFTEKLPLVKLRPVKAMVGNDTETSILTGVLNGTLGGLELMIQYYKKKYPGLKVLLCGGDADFLAKTLKSRIFAVPNLVLSGLNELLEYNER